MPKREPQGASSNLEAYPAQLDKQQGTSTQLTSLSHLKCMAGRQTDDTETDPSWRIPDLLFPDTDLPKIDESRNAVKPAQPEVRPRPRGRQLRFNLRPRWWLSIVLVLQAALSLRLIWLNTAFPDEALYLWAGHLEWAHLLHGTPLPAFPAFFSGAPVIYPPLGAIADSLGGLAGARLLSLCFMLVTTSLLYGVTLRLFNAQTGLYAAGIFAGLASTQYLGAFATYDAMALMLTCTATWLGVRAADSSPSVRVLLTMLAAGAMILGDTAKYAAALFTPVVVLTVVLTSWWRNGRRVGIQSAAVMTVFSCLLLAAVLHLGGHYYWRGITTTTLTRESGSSSRAFLLFVSAKWEGAVVILALIGAAALIAARHRERPVVLLACVLAGTPFLVPIEQARIETYTSLFKHVGYGAWFGAILAGYAFVAFQKAVAPSKIAQTVRISATAVAIVAVPQVPWAASKYGWPNTTNVIPAMKQVISSTNGPILADDRGNVLNYYLNSILEGREIYDTSFFAYNDPVSGRHLTQTPAFAAALRKRYFSIIFLEFWDSVPQDDVVQADINRYGGYKLVAAIPYPATGSHGRAMIWVRLGGTSDRKHP